MLQIDKDLVPINRRLQTYVEQWDVFVDAWLIIKVSNPAFVFTWRQQAESAMKAAGKTGMSDEQVSPPFSISSPLVARCHHSIMQLDDTLLCKQILVMANLTGQVIIALMLAGQGFCQSLHASLQSLSASHV